MNYFKNLTNVYVKNQWLIWHEPLNGLINQITPMTRTLICYPKFLLSHDVTFSFCLTKAETVYVLTAWSNCKYSNLMLISILFSRLCMSASNVIYQWNALSLNFQSDLWNFINALITNSTNAYISETTLKWVPLQINEGSKMYWY